LEVFPRLRSRWLWPANPKTDPWCTSRSMTAVAVISSGKTWVHFSNGRLVVSAILFRSYRCEMSWKSKSVASRSNGTYPSSSMRSRSIRSRPRYCSSSVPLRRVRNRIGRVHWSAHRNANVSEFCSTDRRQFIRTRTIVATARIRPSAAGESCAMNLYAAATILLRQHVIGPVRTLGVLRQQCVFLC